ncbi:hypothetical protein RCL_jg24663.t1 [Rhizophagus clarus]|uniref:Uncharacterized protein n=1 Tax=Rhizophagus clarus TaxID=94130 RepID=A0A8H3M5R8_9GLOM|nr:hypothetical protein RCL_jg24663.t1 [Rhizophagus clarus]
MFKDIQFKFSEKLSFLFLGLIFVPIVKAGSLSNYFNQIIEFPKIDTGANENVFMCETTEYYNKELFPSFYSQIGTFIPATGLLFTVAVYGTTSAFNYKTTCLIDDFVILTFALAPIFSWYTLTKPMWLYRLIKSMNLNNEEFLSTFFENDLIIVILFVSYVIIVIIMVCVVLVFHSNKDYDNKKDENKKRKFYNGFKTFLIWIFLVHSLEVIVFSILQYKYIFSKLLIYSTNKIATSFNLLLLNYISNLLYFFTATFLVITYHFPNLGHGREYQGFVHKKIFFFTIALCIFHLFFEYYWLCTAPILSTLFNYVIIIILTRSIATFFSKNVFICIHKHNDKGKLYAQIKPEVIGKVRTFYTHKSPPTGESRHNSNKEYIKYRVHKVNKVEEHIYVKDLDSKKYYYVIFVNNSTYLYHLRDVKDHQSKKKERQNIREKIEDLIKIDKVCLIHGCEILNHKREEFMEKETKENEVKFIEIEDHILVNVIKTGILNYIVYSHRCSNRKKRGNRDINENNGKSDVELN